MPRTTKRKVLSDSDSISFISVASLPENRSNKNPNFQLICYTVAIIIVFISLVLSLTLPFVFKYSWNKNTLPENQACILCGTVEGSKKDGIIEFLGIPYARPPVGLYKLEPPKELTYPAFCRETAMNDSKSLYQAKHYRPACLQYLPDRKNIIDPNSSEDCLYLNIYTPETFPQTFRPVVVVINGLFHQYGSGNMPYFTVTPALVKTVDAVHVTFNYRLGPLSFSVSRKKKTNFGLLDQIAVLKWVQKNIKKFGGDPKKVVLFGFGSGATYSLIHLTSSSSNLFHKAWLSSPGIVLDRKLMDLKEDTFKSSKLNASNLLSSCTWEQCTSKIVDFMDLSHEANSKILSQISSLPVIDNEIIKENYWTLLGSQNKRIPLVLGMNSHEAGLLPRPETLRLWYPEEYELYVRFKVKDKDSFLSFYSVKNQSTPETQYSLAVTDLRMTCPIIKLANQAVQDMNQLVFLYQVTGEHDFIDLFGLEFPTYLPVHGWDAALYFGSYNLRDFSYLKSILEATDRMRSYMREFLWSDTISEFRHWSAQDPYVNVIEKEGQVKQHPFYKKSECELWSSTNWNTSVWRA